MCRRNEKVRILIITVAGMSTRFSQSLGFPCLKCIYYPKDISESLLYRFIHQPVKFDKYIIVGGYMYDELKTTIHENFVEYLDRIILINNEKYVEYGSGYSLYYGLKAALEFEFDEVVFAEGDLFVDEESFVEVCTASANVVTYNREDILASKSVVFYQDIQGEIHYLYDTGHSAFMINEPFLSIYNSGQIWKFASAKRLRSVYDSLADKDWEGTNLILVERYFQGLSCTEYRRILLKKWINCNTVQDFNKQHNLQGD